MRGRPPSHFHFRAEQGALLIANAGATGVRTAVTDLHGRIRHEPGSIDITVGPDSGSPQSRPLRRVARKRGHRSRFRSWHRNRGARAGGFRQRDGGQPADHDGMGRLPDPGLVRRAVRCPVLVDNDANAMTLGEHTANFAECDSLVMVKVATGIGAGIIAQGEIYRGADGAAGDIGHIQISPPADWHRRSAPVCRCGNTGCLEAYAGGWALIRDLHEGRNVAAIDDIVRLAEAGDPLAVNLFVARGDSSASPCPMW